jgi:hypothetical protein
MKALIALYLMFTISAFCRDETLVSSYEEGEEPGLTHYYFYFTEAGSNREIKRVRWVVDDETSNKAKVTDFIFEIGGIRIKEMAGVGAAREKLVGGKDAELVTTADCLITAMDTGNMLAPPLPDKNLTNAQRSQLHTLIGLLAHDRLPLNKHAKPKADDTDKLLLKLSAVCQNANFLYEQQQWEPEKFAPYINEAEEILNKLVESDFFEEATFKIIHPSEMTEKDMGEFERFKMDFVMRLSPRFGFNTANELIGFKIRPFSGEFLRLAKDKPFLLQVRLTKEDMKEFRKAVSRFESRNRHASK